MALQKTAQSDPYFDAPTAASQSPSGWDKFLTGTARLGGSFLSGFAAGLQGYDPRNEYSSFGAAIAGATPGLQAALRRPAQEQQAAFLRQQKRLDELSELETGIEMQRRNVAGSSVVPGGEAISGISAGIAKPQPSKPSTEPFEFKLFSAGPPTTSAESVLRLMQGGKR